MKKAFQYKVKKSFEAKKVDLDWRKFKEAVQ